jgi:hypothetical protein
MDVKTTFLNNMLEGNIFYMVQSYSFEVQVESHKVANLRGLFMALSKPKRVRIFILMI